MHLSHPSFPRTSSLWLCPCVKLHTWRSPSPSHPWTPRSPCMYGIALPTLLLDTLCGRFSMTGKVEAIRRTPQIEMTYFSFSFIHLNWMGLSWWVLNLLAAQSTKNNTFDESFQKSYEKYEFLILGVNCPLFKLQYMQSLLSSWQCFIFLRPGQMSQPFGQHEKLFPCGQPGQDHLPLPSQEVWCQDLCLLGPSHRPSKSRGSKVITSTLKW